MCHCLAVDGDTSDFDFGVLLAMSAEFFVALAALFLEHEHLIALAMRANRCMNRRIEYRYSKLNAVGIEQRQDIPQFNGFADLGMEMGDNVALVRLYPKLLASDFNNCLHERAQVMLGLQK
jgi:hypothetical protein